MPHDQSGNVKLNTLVLPLHGSLSGSMPAARDPQKYAFSLAQLGILALGLQLMPDPFDRLMLALMSVMFISIFCNLRSIAQFHLKLHKPATLERAAGLLKFVFPIGFTIPMLRFETFSVSPVGATLLFVAIWASASWLAFSFFGALKKEAAGAHHNQS